MWSLKSHTMEQRYRHIIARNNKRNEPLMEYKASLAGEFFVTYATLESLGPLVRIQV